VLAKRRVRFQEPRDVGKVLLSLARAACWIHYRPQLDLALQSLRDIPYSRWRDYSPEDTLRFHGLRLHEVGMIKSSPQKIIAQGTDWRFLNELQKELRG
jgi:hypothetical protein